MTSRFNVIVTVYCLCSSIANYARCSTSNTENCLILILFHCLTPLQAHIPEGTSLWCCLRCLVALPSLWCCLRCLVALPSLWCCLRCLVALPSLWCCLCCLVALPSLWCCLHCLVALTISSLCLLRGGCHRSSNCSSTIVFTIMVYCFLFRLSSSCQIATVLQFNSVVLAAQNHTLILALKLKTVSF